MKSLSLDSIGSRQNPVLDLNLLNDKPLEERVKGAILNDLLRLGWRIEFVDGRVEVTPPQVYSKETIRNSMALRRDETLLRNAVWLSKYSNKFSSLLASGKDVLKSKIIPAIEVCESEKQHRIFRFFRHYWSSPYSDYVGRRIKLLIRDNGIASRPIIGIAALGSPIIHIPERDEFIGWSNIVRTSNLIYAMDAYVIGALPPYNELLGGKLVSYLLCSNEVRDIYKKKYRNSITLINNRKSSDLAAIFTTSLYGKSAQYNRINFNGQSLFNLIGFTKGYGTLHLSDHTISLMRELINERGIFVGNRFGDGPSWKMRLIRVVAELLKFDSDFLLRHSFRRGIYYVPLAENAIEFLNGFDSKLKSSNMPQSKLVKYWKERWFESRKQKSDIQERVKGFDPNNFMIT